MSDLTATVYCCLCDKRTEHVVQMPEGWAHICGSMEEETDGFCPDHAPVKEFADSQCPGCVGGWGDCPLWQSFAYSRRTITTDDLAQIRKGFCPKRVNGTIGVSNGVIEDIDLSEQSMAGNALAEAIEAYMHRFPER